MYLAWLGWSTRIVFFFSSRRRHTRSLCDWSSDVCSSDLDRTGSGNGMVVQRGFPQPPSFHVDRMRNAPIGHFFDVMTNGYGVMYSYATRVEPDDRWAIAAYIRALQLSHNAALSDVDSADRATLDSKK